MTLLERIDDAIAVVNQQAETIEQAAELELANVRAALDMLHHQRKRWFEQAAEALSSDEERRLKLVSAFDRMECALVAHTVS